MSDRVGNSYYSSDRKAGQSIHPCQSAWMAHWGRTECDSSTQKHNYMLSPRKDNKEDHDIKLYQFLSGSEIARSVKEFQAVEHGSAENIKVSAGSSRNLTNESLDCQEIRRSFNLKSERGMSNMQALRPQASRGKLPAALNILPVSAPAAETLTRPEGFLQLPVHEVKYHMFFGESNYSCSRQRSSVPYTSRNDEFKPDCGKNVIPSFIRRQEEIKQVTSIISSKHVTKTNLTIMGQEHCNYQGHSALLVCEDKRRNFLECEKSATSQRSNNMTALKIGPSAGTYISPAHDDGQYHGMQNHFTDKSFPSSEGLAGGQYRFSPMTHRLLITERTDFDLLKENQILGDSRGNPQLNQHAFRELNRNFPLFNHGKQGVRLQLLSSSTDNEEKEAAGVVKTSEVIQKNESSAETEFMDMESFEEKNHDSGVNPSSSNKDSKMDPNLALLCASTSAAVSRKRTIELPDINIELPTSPTSPISIKKSEQSTSRTQSLDIDLLLGNANKPGNLESSDCQNASLESEHSSRWVKRLKLATPSSAALRIKKSNQEQFSDEDMSKFFNITNKGNSSSSEPSMDKATKLIQKRGSSSLDTGMKDQDIRLSHSWIQRWRHNQDKKKPERLVTSDPQSIKLGNEDLEKKQFPSIAAMALMGKVMNGFQPCQYQKKKSFIIWNTKNL